MRAGASSARASASKGAGARGACARLAASSEASSRAVASGRAGSSSAALGLIELQRARAARAGSRVAHDALCVAALELAEQPRARSRPSRSRATAERDRVFLSMSPAKWRRCTTRACAAQSARRSSADRVKSSSPGASRRGTLRAARPSRPPPRRSPPRARVLDQDAPHRDRGGREVRALAPSDLGRTSPQTAARPCTAPSPATMLGPLAPHLAPRDARARRTSGSNSTVPALSRSPTAVPLRLKPEGRAHPAPAAPTARARAPHQDSSAVRDARGARGAAASRHAQHRRIVASDRAAPGSGAGRERGRVQARHGDAVVGLKPVPRTLAQVAVPALVVVGAGRRQGRFAV
jgi:hypothetical protein